LLHLVKREGIDLRRMPIAPIADAYLAYLDRMREMHLGIAAEYLVMAATLCHLKSLEILPRPPTSTEAEEEPEDPKAALVRQLAEYQRYREAADHLGEQPLLGRDVFGREPEDLGHVPKPIRAGLDAFALLDLFHELLRKATRPEHVHEVHANGLDFGSCCRHVLRSLGGPGGRSDLAPLIAPLRTRVEKILTFLAVLEMIRLRWLELEQEEHLGPIVLTSRVKADTDIDAVLGRIEVA
jgi:segregation and condensation protein A